MKRVLFFSMMIILLATWVQVLFKPFGIPPLMGVTQVPTPSIFSLKNTVNESYQKHIQHWAQVEAGFSPSLIRVVNSFNYHFFDILNSTVVRGKENHLFEKGYIQTLEGRDYMGEENARERVQELKNWAGDIDENTKIIIVLAPNKAEIRKEFLPQEVESSKRNYPLMKQLLVEAGFQVLDVHEWFMKLPIDQTTTTYGTHWSMYGAALVADSLVQLMNEHSENNSYKTEITKLESSTEPRFTDNDLEGLLNLMYPLPRQTYRYATLQFEAEKKPVVLGIGDSYYWSFYDLGMVSQLFDPKSEYWYYGHELYDMNKTKQAEKDGELLQAPNKADFIIIVTTEPNLIRFPFGLGNKAKTKTTDGI